MANVGTLMATLSLDPSKFNSGLAAAEAKASGFGRGVATGANLAGVAVAGLGVAAVAGLTASVVAAAGFEKQIDAVGAVAGATEPQMKGLADTALRIGKDTAFSASEAASAMETLAASGVPVEDIMNGAADATVALAAAGGTDLVTAANVASSALSVWGLETSELTDVVNRVAGAANVSKFGVEDMSLAIAQGGGAAAAAGVPMSDFMTVIASGAAYFASGSDAGTSFKTFLMRLAAPSAEAAQLMGELGINAFDASGNMKGMGEIAGDLQSALGPLTEEQRANALATIFGSDASRTAIALMEQGEDGFKSMDATMKGSDAAAIAAQRMDNFAGSMEQLKGTIEVLMIELGMKLLPVLTDIAKFLAENIPKAVDAAKETFDRWHDALAPIIEALADKLGPALERGAELFDEFVKPILAHEATLQTAAIIIGVGLVAGFVALGIAAGTAAIGVLAATWPFLALVVGIGLLISGIVLLIQHWDEITAKFPIIVTVIDAVKEGFQAFVNWIQNEFVPAFQKLYDDIATPLNAIKTFIQTHADAIKEILSSAWELIRQQAENVWNLIKGIVEGAMKIIQGIIDVVMGVTSGDWGRAWDGIKQIVDGVWTIIKSIVQYGIDTVKNVLSNGLDLVKALWGLAWDVIGEKVTSAWESIKSTVSSGIESVKSTISSGWESIKGAAQAAWDWVVNQLQAAWDRIKSATDTSIYDLILKIGEIQAKALGALAGLPQAFFQAGVDAVQGLINGIGSMIASAASKVGELASATVGKIKSFGRSPWPATIEAGQDFGEGFAIGIESSQAAAVGTTERFAEGNNRALAEGLAAWQAGKEVAVEWMDATEDLRNEMYRTSLEGLASAYSLGDSYGRVKDAAEKAGLSMAAISRVPLEQLRLLIPMADEYRDIMQKIAFEDELDRHISQTLPDWQNGIGKTREQIQAMQNAMMTARDAWQAGWYDMDYAILIAGNDIQEILAGSQRSADDWVKAFQTDTLAASQAWNLLNDDMRFILGENLALQEEWARHGLYVYEDFSISTRRILESITAAAGEAAAGVARHVAEITNQVNAATAAGATLQNTAPVGGDVPPGYWITPQGNVAKIPGYAGGTSYHPGGLAMVGERGPELVSLPRGAKVYPGLQAMATRAREMFREWAVNNNGPINIYANSPAEGLSALRDWSYAMAAAARARGLE